MAIADELRSFLEARLRAFDPTIDLSPGALAQTRIIDAVILRFSEDPFSTSIPTFIRERMSQEFPDLAVDDGGMLDDVFSKPLRMLLEPFKREIETIKRNQSIQNAHLMSDDEVDSIGANWFETRDEGASSGGGVRLFYSAPSTSSVTTDKRLFTSTGLSFFPVQNYTITASQMLFNRQGSFYFLDIVVRAESPGSNYNIKRAEIVGIDGVPGVIKVTNQSDFVGGAPRESNEVYAGRFAQSLTERSLGTKRGILARTTNLFDSVRALQVIGAGEEEMTRDILTGTGEGFLHLAGSGTLYGDWLWVNYVTFCDDGPDNSVLPRPGDLVRFHPTVVGLAPTEVVSAKVIYILPSTTDKKYLFLLDHSPYPSNVSRVGSVALFKPGFITISKIPGGITSTTVVPDGTVHLGGHTDVFVRPTSDSAQQTVLSAVADGASLVTLLDLTVPLANQNQVASASANFLLSGVAIGDSLVIETGATFAGTYRVLKVSTTSLRVDKLFTGATLPAQRLRARVVHNILVNLADPIVPKLPFTPSPVFDLQTSVGSREFRFDLLNIQEFGAKIGDVIRVLEGPDTGEFVISSFSSAPGTVVLVNRPATATAANLSYKLYTKLNGLTFPLVRLKSLEVVDSVGQETGITIPYGDAVEIHSTCDFEGAGRELVTYDKQLMVFPDMGDIWGPPGGLPTLPSDGIPSGNIDNSTDARFTQKLEFADGVVRQVLPHTSNPIDKVEINLPPFMWNGKRDKLIALTTHTDPRYPSTVAGVHRTSDIAESRIGDSLTIYDGPNRGRYLIKDMRILDLWGKSDTGHRKVALLQVDPPLKVDPIRTAINFINDMTGGSFWGPENFVGLLEYVTDWYNPSGFFTEFLTKLRVELAAKNVTFATYDEFQSFFDSLFRSSYSVGPSARGKFRMHFLEPVSVELFHGGGPPTIFRSAINESKVFQIDPSLPPAQVLPDSLELTLPAKWNRNLGVPDSSLGASAYLTSGASFAARGIREGDVLEFHPAVNDLPARGNMTSSWLCVTQAGTNVVRLILPPLPIVTPLVASQIDNYQKVQAGQFLFIDSGPDIGAYSVTKVISQNWALPEPLIEVQLDTVLTHTTSSYPASTSTGFISEVASETITSGMTFPLINLQTKKLRIYVSEFSFGGGSVTREHTFAELSYANVAALVAEINTGTLTAGGFLFAFDAGENCLGVRASTIGPRWSLYATSESTAIAAGLSFAVGGPTLERSVSPSGVVLAIGGSKRICGSGLSGITIGKYLSLYAANSRCIYPTNKVIVDGDDAAWIGTFEITSAPIAGTSGELTGQLFVELDKPLPFPVGTRAHVKFVIHDSPPETSPSATSNGGKELSSQYVRFRLYDHVARRRKVLGSPWDTFTTSHPLTTASQEQITLDAAIMDSAAGQSNFSHKSPYRILRPGLVRASSTSMSKNREGAFYYLDVPTIGVGPGADMNVTPLEGFFLEGRRNISGYTLAVRDENFTFSHKEEVSIVLPNWVLPVGSSPDTGNEFPLFGQSIRVSYESAELVEELQRFFDSPLDRVMAASILVRHFLPAYVIVDAEYTGGATESRTAMDIIEYINNIDPNTAELRADLVQDIIKNKGATRVTMPLLLVALFHGTDRKIRGMRSEDSIGASNVPFFKGTFNQAYFIAGTDTSGAMTRPIGEQVFLKKV